MCDAVEEIRLYVMEKQFSLSIKGSSWLEFNLCPTIITLVNQLQKSSKVNIFSLINKIKI